MRKQCARSNSHGGSVVISARRLPNLTRYSDSVGEMGSYTDTTRALSSPFEEKKKTPLQIRVTFDPKRLTIAFEVQLPLLQGRN